MDFIQVLKGEVITTVTLNRNKVNALNEQVMDEFQATFEQLERDESIRSIVLTGQRKFFSFGFDVPELNQGTREDYNRFLTKFTDFYTYLFTFPKPVIAAINGHAIGGGCMLTLACDYRVMVSGKAKISLNEITFGSSVFAGSIEMLRTAVGQKNAELFVISGGMYTAEEASRFGLIDQVSAGEALREDAGRIAYDMGQKDPAPFAGIKGLLRKPIAEQMRKRERAGIEEFLDIWYSESTWKQVQNIKIHS